MKKKRSKEEEEERKLLNGMLIDNLQKLVMERRLVIPVGFKQLVKEFKGLAGKTRDECIEYLDKCPSLSALCLAVYPVEKDKNSTEE